VVGSCVHHVVVAGSSPSLVGPTVVGAAVVGDAVVGEAVVGDAVVGEAVVGDAVVGDAVVGVAVVGDSVVGPTVVGMGVGASTHSSCAPEVSHRQPFGSASAPSQSAWIPHCSQERAHVNPTQVPALSPAPAIMQLALDPPASLHPSAVSGHTVQSESHVPRLTQICVAAGRFWLMSFVSNTRQLVFVPHVDGSSSHSEHVVVLVVHIAAALFGVLIAANMINVNFVNKSMLVESIKLD